MKNYNQTRQMLKDMINENAVAFKENTAKNLYLKVQTKLDEQYKKVSKNIFKTNTK